MYGVELTDRQACLAVLVAGQRSQASFGARVAVIVLLEVFEPTYATSAGLPAVLPTPRASEQTALPQSMLESTASDLLVHFTS